jgi:hypothetical protein
MILLSFRPTPVQTGEPSVLFPGIQENFERRVRHIGELWHWRPRIRTSEETLRSSVAVGGGDESVNVVVKFAGGSAIDVGHVACAEM